MKAKALNKISQRIFQVRDHDQFNELAIDIFYLQYENNPVYRNYCTLLGRNYSELTSFSEIPCLPVEFFKTHHIASVSGKPEFEFHSSGTSGSMRSKHPVFDSGLYGQSICNGFRLFYGEPSSYCFIVLVPDPGEFPESSLAYMARLLIDESHHPDSGFYLGRESLIPGVVNNLQGRKLFVLGLSYALADLAARNPTDLAGAIVMETGGMKGRSKELIREELHSRICRGFNIKSVHSEYSMSELFSQAYSTSGGIFSCPTWMHVLIREPQDPFAFSIPGKAGGINIIDLANINTCSFIATQDIGRIYKEREFEVLGRFDNSDLRGCSLMI